MKTTKDLMFEVKVELENKGFEIKHFDENYQATATKNGKSERRPVDGYDFTRLYGFTINFEVVHRHNGTDANQSVDVMIYEWEASSGRRVAKERVNTKMSNKSIANRIAKIVEMYEAI